MSIFDLYEGIYSSEREEEREVIPPRAMEAVEWLRKGYKIWEITDRMMVSQAMVVKWLRMAIKAGVIDHREQWKGYVPDWLWNYAVKEFPLATWKVFDPETFVKHLAVFKWSPLSDELAKPIVREGLLKLITGEGRIGIEKVRLTPVMAMFNSEKPIVDYATKLWGVATHVREVEPRRILCSGEINGLKVTILCKDWRRILAFRSDVARWIYEEVGYKATPDQYDYFMKTWGHATRKEKVRIITPVESSEEEIEFVEEEVDADLILPPEEW